METDVAGCWVRPSLRGQWHLAVLPGCCWHCLRPYHLPVRGDCPALWTSETLPCGFVLCFTKVRTSSQLSTQHDTTQRDMIRHNTTQHNAKRHNTKYDKTCPEDGSLWCKDPGRVGDT